MSGSPWGANPPEVRLRPTIRLEGCDTNNNLDDTYNSDVIAEFIRAFALHIATNSCRARNFEVVLEAKPATMGVKVGEFNEAEWRDMLMRESLEPDAPIELLAATAHADSDGTVQARYTFLLVKAP